MQIIRSGVFEMYDHGSNKNMRIYGSTTPPPYDLSRVKVPVAVFWGPNDAVADPVVGVCFVRNLLKPTGMS